MTDIRNDEGLRRHLTIQAMHSATEWVNWPFAGNDPAPRVSSQKDGAETSLMLGSMWASHCQALACDLGILVDVLLNHSICGLPIDGEEELSLLIDVAGRLVKAARRTRRQAVIAYNRWGMGDLIPDGTLKGRKRAPRASDNGRPASPGGLADAEPPF